MSTSQDHCIDTDVPSIASEIDDDAVKVVERLIKCIEQTKEFFDLRPDWSQKYCASNSIALSHDMIQAKNDTDAVLRATPVFDVLNRGHDLSYDIMSWFAHQFAIVDTHINSLKLRAGFLSLPDDILITVLEFASYEQYGDGDDAIRNTVNAATKLSHVCVRFRAAALATVTLWNRISSSMKIDAISTCFDRCGPAGVDIVLSRSPTGAFKDLFPFYQRIKQETRLWRRFGRHYPHIAYLQWEDILHLKEWNQDFRNLEIPLLSKLAIHLPYSVPYINSSNIPYSPIYEEALDFYSNWTSPKLRSMRVENFFPVTFPGTKFLTDLTLTLDFKHPDIGRCPMNMKTIATFVSSCEVLEDFLFRLHNCEVFIPSLSCPRVDILTVTDLFLDFSFCSNAVIEDFFSVLHFPEVRSMDLVCTWNERKGSDDIPADDKNMIEAVFPDSNKFPKLEDLRLDIVVYGPRSANSRVCEPNEPIYIPFPNFPQLKSLELTTWLTVLKPLTEGPILPKLAELSFFHCTWHELDWFVTLFERIVAHHDSGESVKLTFENCPWEHQWEEALEARRGRAGGVSDSIIEEEDGAEDNSG